MKPRILAAALVAGLVAFAGPAWSEPPNGANAGGAPASAGGASAGGGSASGGGGNAGGGPASGGGGYAGGGSASGGGGYAGGGHASDGGHSWSGGHVAGGGGHVAGGGRGATSGHPSGGAPHPGAGHRGGDGHGATPGHPPGGATHPGVGHPGGGRDHGWRGHHGWRGYDGWVDPFWWGTWWGLEWPYAWGEYYGLDTPVAPADDFTLVETDVSPEDAWLYLNGVLIGTARDFDGDPDVLYLRPGHYTIEFRLPGYRGRALELDATGGEATIPITLELVPDHSVTLVAPYRPPEGLPFGRVFGPDFGHAASELEPRPAPGMRMESRTEAGAVSAPPMTTAKTGLAALKLRISPPNAAVYLDGEFLGSGAELGRLQRGVAVLSGPHRLEVLAPGCAAKSVVIETEPGKELTIELDLTR
jgi:hypothetical protein